MTSDRHDDAAASIKGIDRDRRRRPAFLAGPVEAGKKDMLIIGKIGSSEMLQLDCRKR